MAKYRQPLDRTKHEYLIEKYKGLINQSGGLFSPTRSKLLGQKPEDEAQNYVMESVFPDKPKFWHLLTKNVTTSLADLQLIAEVGSDAELNQMFRELTHVERDKIKYTTDLVKLLETLLRACGETEIILKEDILWKAKLVKGIVNMCYTFLNSHGMITSQAHKRTIDEAKNLITTEITSYERKGEGEIRTSSGKPMGKMTLVPQNVIDRRRVELSTAQKRDIEIKAYEKLAMKKAKARLEAEEKVEPAEKQPDKKYVEDINDSIDLELERRTKSFKPKFKM